MRITSILTSAPAKFAVLLFALGLAAGVLLWFAIGLMALSQVDESHRYFIIAAMVISLLLFGITLNLQYYAKILISAIDANTAELQALREAQIAQLKGLQAIAENTASTAREISMLNDGAVRSTQPLRAPD